LQVLLQVDLEVQPEQFLKDKKTLTRIVAHGTRDYLIRHALLLRAMLWQEKAERDQLLANRAADGNATAARAARDAWTNTRNHWNQYLDRAALGPSARQQRLDAIRAHVKRSESQASHLLEDLHLDMHQYYAARLNQARAVYRADGPKAAAVLLQNLDEELTALMDKGMNADIDAVRPPAANAALNRSLNLLRNDWMPLGNYWWFQKQVRRQLKMWEKS
jgi:hypothetical protein